VQPVLQDEVVDTSYLGLLRCEEETCKSRLPLFARWSIAMSASDRKEAANTWIWDGLLCERSHPILKPKCI
jgi:hypothetical protein